MFHEQNVPLTECSINRTVNATSKQWRNKKAHHSGEEEEENDANGYGEYIHQEESGDLITDRP